jgi:metal-responsive CopG/Arc/MetJ family transcriptional regulator
MSSYNIMAIRVSRRSKNAEGLQSVFTRHGCIIKVRLGLHEAGDVCSEDGLIILQLVGDKDEIAAFQEELNAIEGVKAKTMEI